MDQKEFDAILKSHKHAEESPGDIADRIIGMGQPKRTIGGTLKDIGVTSVNAAIGAGEAVVGLADLATGGMAGKGLSQLGYDPKAARNFLQQYKSEAQQAADRRVDEAKGFGGTLKAYLRNPSTIVEAGAESLPSMFLGGGIGRGIGAAGKAAGILSNPAARAGLLGAIGEGVVGAGSAAEQIRQETGELTGKGAASAIGSGVGTGVLGRLGNKLAPKLGAVDIEEALVRGFSGNARNVPLSFGKTLKAITGGAISEGAFEELPQSIQEQVWQNYATGKPLMEGVPEGAAQGLVTGAAMGGAVNIHSALPGQQRKALAELEQKRQAELAQEHDKLVREATRGQVVLQAATGQNLPGVSSAGLNFDGGSGLPPGVAPYMAGQNASTFDLMREQQQRQAQTALDLEQRQQAAREQVLQQERIQNQLAANGFGYAPGQRAAVHGAPDEMASALAGETEEEYQQRLGNLEQRRQQGQQGLINVLQNRVDMQRQNAQATAGAIAKAAQAAKQQEDEQAQRDRFDQWAAAERAAGRDVGPFSMDEQQQAKAASSGPLGKAVAKGFGALNEAERAVEYGRIFDRGATNTQAIEQIQAERERAFLGDGESSDAGLPEFRQELAATIEGVDFRQQPGSKLPPELDYQVSRMEAQLQESITGTHEANVAQNGDTVWLKGKGYWPQWMEKKTMPRGKWAKQGTQEREDQAEALKNANILHDAGRDKILAVIDKARKGVALGSHEKSIWSAVERIASQPGGPALWGQSDMLIADANEAAANERMQARYGLSMLPKPMTVRVADIEPGETLAVDGMVEDAVGKTVLYTHKGIDAQGNTIMERGEHDAVTGKTGAARVMRFEPTDHLEGVIGVRERADREQNPNRTTKAYSREGKAFRSIEKQGIAITEPQNIPVDMLRPGDRVVIRDPQGMPDVATMRGYDSNNRAVIRDGIEYHLQADDNITVEGFRAKGEVRQTKGFGYRPKNERQQIAREYEQDRQERAERSEILREAKTQVRGELTNTLRQIAGKRRIHAEEQRALATQANKRQQAGADSKQGTPQAVMPKGSRPTVSLGYGFHPGDNTPTLERARAQKQEQKENRKTFPGTQYETGEQRVRENRRNFPATKYETGKPGRIEREAFARPTVYQQVKPAAESIGKQSPSVEQELHGMTPEDLDAMIGGIFDQQRKKEDQKKSQTRKTVQKPEKGRTKGNNTTTKQVDNQQRQTESLRDRMQNELLDDVEQGILQKAKEKGASIELASKAAKEAAAAVREAFEGLNQLFSSKNRLGSGLVFDEETYRQAKPHFVKAWNHFKQAGKTLQEIIRKFAQMYGLSAEPYVKRFALDVQAGRINTNEESHEQQEKSEQKIGRSDEQGAIREDAENMAGNSPGALGTVPAAVVSGGNGNRGRSGDEGKSRRGRTQDGAGNTGSDEGRSPALGSGRDGQAEVRSNRAGARGEQISDGGRSRTLNEEHLKSTPATIPSSDFRITPELGLGKGGEVQKFNDNIAAIKTLQEIRRSGRRATPAEQGILAKYVGWGGLANAFPRPDGSVAKGWEERVKIVQSLLSPEDYATARNSTQNAHYTSETILRAMWRAVVDRIGFKGGNALEPSVGTGNFLGTIPDAIKGHTRFVASEFDGTTAEIAKLLYPEQSIFNSPFEEMPLATNSYDLVIGNPPFGTTKLNFTNFTEANGYSIHNQFMLAGIEALKPGGIQAFVVSRYFMDAKTQSAREAVSRKAKLLCAVRLPGSAFAENARTEVVTDIVFLQKYTESELEERDEREASSGELEVPEWVRTKDFVVGAQSAPVNEYFVNHPLHILGEMHLQGTMRRENDLGVTYKGEPASMAADLDRIIDRAMPWTRVAPVNHVEAQKIYDDMVESIEINLAGGEYHTTYINESGKLIQVEERLLPTGEYALTRRELVAGMPVVNNGELTLMSDGRWMTETDKLDMDGKPVKVRNKNGKLTNRNIKIRVYYKEDEVPEKFRISEDEIQRLRSAIELRDLLKHQILLESKEETVDAAIDANRNKLKECYNKFTRKYGYLNNKKTEKIIHSIPDGPLLLSLESDYTKGGKGKQEEQAKQADILSKRVIFPYTRQTKVESATDALSVSLSENGRVDIDQMAEMLGINPDQVIEKLCDRPAKPIIFYNPETSQWEPASEYLSGNVRKKLNAALAHYDNAVAQGENESEIKRCERAIDALRDAQPEPWSSDHITPIAGATWIPPQVYSDFFTELTGGQVNIFFFKATGQFSVEIVNPGIESKMAAWQTRERSADEILDALLNSKTIKVTKKDAVTGRYITDTEASDAANDKVKEMQEYFSDWIFKDAARREELTGIFNDRFNIRVNKQYDGSFLRCPGMTSAITLRRHQKNAIWRGITDRFVLYDHAVGAGKTFTGIARAMERKRMGLSRKPMVIVPNHLVKQFAADALRLYPRAKVLAPQPEDMARHRRRVLFSKIATGEWDLIVMPHSSFGFIGISPGTEARYIQENIDMALNALSEARELTGYDQEQGDNGKSKPLPVKQAEALVSKLREQLKKAHNKGRNRDRLLTFEQMGIDDLTIDEAHEFKNLFYSSNMQAAGMNPRAGSGKAYDLWTKIRVLRETNGSVAFMTGTPISNSAVEMYVQMRYLAADELTDVGLDNFDAWRTQFVTAESSYEPNDTGAGLKMVTRLGREWSNMRSLMDLYYSFADCVDNSDIQQWYKEDTGKDFPLPKIAGGGRQNVVVEPTPAQVEILRETIQDYNGLKSISDINERNAKRLQLMDRARKISLDARAVDPNLPEQSGGKVVEVGRRVADIYRQYDDVRGTQLVFLDRSVPKTKGDDKILKEYREAQAAYRDAEAGGDEAAMRQAVERLEKFNAAEMAELETAQIGGWNAYDQIKKHLVENGVPENEIAFVQEANTPAQKQTLFDAVKRGDIRVLIGSTQRMGAGTNVQDRLVALHHVDATWKPSDIEQREGRIIRQGNLFASETINGEPNPEYRPDFEIQILAYATRRTVDAKMWSLNATKLKMINGIRKYGGEFNIEFDDADTVSMAEIAAEASGDPMQLERVKLSSEIDRLTRQRRAFVRQQQETEYQVRKAKDLLQTETESRAWYEHFIPLIKQGAEDALAYKRGLVVTMDGKEYTGADRADAFEHVKEAARATDDAEGRVKFLIEIDGKQYKSRFAAENALIDALGDAMPIVIGFDGKKYADLSMARRAVAEAVYQKTADKALELDDISLGVFEYNGLKFDASVSTSMERSGRTGEPIRMLDFVFTQQVPKGTEHLRIVSMPRGSFQKDGHVNMATVTTMFSEITKTLNNAENDHKRFIGAVERAKANLEASKGMMDREWSKQGELDSKKDRLQVVEKELAQKGDDDWSLADEDTVLSAGQQGNIPAPRKSMAKPLPESERADIEGELITAIGKLQTRRLFGSIGQVKILDTQDDAQRVIASGHIVKTEVRHSKGGAIQGITMPDGQVYLVRDGIAKGQAMPVLLHELGEHAAQLGFKDMQYRAILRSLERQAKDDSETGRAIQKGIARARAAGVRPDNKYYWSEVAAYTIEENADVHTSLLDRIVNYFKGLFLKVCGVQAGKFSHKDLVMFAKAAVKATARRGAQFGKYDPQKSLWSADESQTGLRSISEALAQREYDEVVKRYKGTAQWLKAPNGKPSNLNERQWVQVRTPSFKKWFGDWESLATARAIRDLVPVDAANVQEISSKRDIENYFRNNSAVTNTRNGVTVSFPIATAGKIYHHKGLPVGRIVGRLKEIFEHSIPFLSEKEDLKEGHKAHPNIDSFDHYVGKVSLGEGAGGGEYYVRFTVRKEVVGKKGNTPRQETHNVAVSDVQIYEKPDAANLTGNTPGEGSQPAFVDSKLRDFFAKVKSEEVSTVLDANGEPLVVYHGSGEQRNIITPGMRDPGAWFTSNFRNAANYAKGDESTIHDTFLAIKNPLVVTFDYGEDGDLVPFINGEAVNIDNNVDLVEYAQRRGYDGVHFPEGNFTEEDDTWVAFQEEQIKSATDNTGDFDSENPDIRYSRRKAGEITTLFQTAYHGSPYRFSGFTLENIGGGEGAQVHGWGLYFALDRDVSEGYLAKLGDDNPAYKTIYGSGVKTNDGWIWADESDPENGWTLPSGSADDIALEAMEDAGGVQKDAISALEERLEDLRDDIDLELEEGEELEDALKENEEYQNVLEALGFLRDVEYERTSSGQLYEVDIPDDDVMLREDAALEEQPEQVREAVKKLFAEHGLDPDDAGNGREIYEELSETLGGDEDASRALNEAGVRGIRYNGDIDGECAVVFDDKAIEILDTFYQAEAQGSLDDVLKQLYGQIMKSGESRNARTPWTEKTSKAIIMGPHGSARKSNESLYRAAKEGGDPKAAYELVAPLVTKEGVDAIRAKLRDVTSAVVVPVVSEERLGRNKIPRAYADILADRLGAQVAVDIVHINKVNRSGSDGFHRLAAQPEFDGAVEAGREYIIVDDTLAQGGTLASLKGFIEQKGGRVVAISALTGKDYSAKLRPNTADLALLRKKYPELEAFWYEEFGYGFDRLTSSEANYLCTVKGHTFDTIRDRILAERRQGGASNHSGSDSTGQSGGPASGSLDSKSHFPSFKSAGKGDGANPSSDSGHTSSRTRFQQVREQINRILPNKDEARAIIAIIEARAFSAGLTPEEFVTKRGLTFVDAELPVNPQGKLLEKMMGGQLRGAFNVRDYVEEGRAIITAFRGNANVSTLAHELGHLFRQDLKRYGQDRLLAMAEHWAGVKNGRWNREQEEKFARGFEAYLLEGKAPTTAMGKVFERFRVWISRLYGALVGSQLNVGLDDEIRSVFDALLTEHAAEDAGDAFAEGIAKTRARIAELEGSGPIDLDHRTLFQIGLADSGGAGNTFTGWTSAINRIMSSHPKWRDRWERFIYNMVDTNDPRERIWKAVGSPDAQDIVTVERLRGKKAAAEQKTFRDGMVTPLLKTMAAAGLKASDLEEYAHAMHAPERNQRMREVNAKRVLESLLRQMPAKDADEYRELINLAQSGLRQGWDTTDVQRFYLDQMQKIFNDLSAREQQCNALARTATSNAAQQRVAKMQEQIAESYRIRDKWRTESQRFAGITDGEAQSIVAKWRQDKRFAAIEDARQQLSAISRATLDTLHEAGELGDEEYQALRNGYQYYVPLHRDGFQDTRPATGRVTGPTGRPFKVAKGSMLEVVNILPEVIRAHETAINRKHKLEAGRALYEFALAHPDAGITVEKQEQMPTHDREGNIVMYTRQTEPEDGVFVKVKGKRYLLRFEADVRTPEGRTLARFLDSIKGQDAQLGGITKSLHKITRLLAAVNTSLSPEFVVSNFSRDLQTALIHLNQEDINMQGLQSQVLKSVGKAVRGIWLAERGKPGNNEMARWYRDFEKNGGKVGWVQNYDGIEDLSKKLAGEMKLYEPGNRARKITRAVLDFIDAGNVVIENALRLATYKAMVEKGIDRAKAAGIASNLTVDFTRKGKLSPQINALYMFFNASVQGSYRMAKALATSPRVRKIAGGIAASGFLLQMLALAGGGDDDSDEPYVLGLPDSTRERYILIPMPGQDGRFFKFPKAYGYGALYDLGAEVANSMYMGMTGRQYNHAKGAMRVVSSFANSFNPIQSATILQTIAPTLVDPFVYVGENTNWTGLPLRPAQNNFGPKKPESGRAWKNTNPIYKSIAEGVNSLTGGDRYESGLVDISPEVFEMAVNTALGGLGRFIGNTAALPLATAKGKLDAEKIPFVRQVYAKWDDRALSNRYYEAMERAQIARMRFKNAETLAEKRSIFDSPEYKIWRQSNATDKQVKRLRARLNRMEAAGNTVGADYLRKQIVGLQSKVLSTIM